MRYFKIIMLLFIYLNIQIKAQDTIYKAKNYSLNGYIKDMQSVLFTNFKDQWINDNLLHNRLNFKWSISHSLLFNLQMRNRLLFGDLISYIPSYDSIIKTDNNLLKLNKNLYSEKSFILNSTLDRLNLDLTINKIQITLGRQRINWGQTFVWNPNDIFNAYSFLDFDYEERPGSDAMRIQYHNNETSKIEAAIKADKNKKLTYSGLYNFNRNNYDIQMLAGIVSQEDFVGGVGWSGDLLKGSFRAEASCFVPLEKINNKLSKPKNTIINQINNSIILISLGYDYIFKNSLYLQTEMLYNSAGLSKGTLSFNDYYFKEFTIKNLSLTRYSFFASASYPVSSLFNTVLSAIYSPNDNSLVCIPNFTYSLNDNAELSLILQSFYNFKNTKFLANLFFIRLKINF